jgi:uncharacterized protein YraI
MSRNTHIPATQTRSNEFIGLDATTTPQFPYSAVVTVSLNVRDGAGEEYAALRILNVGDAVTVYQEAPASDGGIWGKIGDGAWVNLKYLEISILR